MMDFRIETFLAICEAKSYTKAAEKLCITQPAVSQHIKYLEDRFRARLFKSSGRQFALTEAGLLLYRYASAAQSEGKKVEAMLMSGEISVPLRIGATRTIGEYVVPPALGAYLRARPEAQVSMIVDNTAVLLRRLAEGSIDFALIEGIFQRKDFETAVFLRDALILVCPPDDPLAGKEAELGELLGRRLILREQGSGSRLVLENALAGLNASIADFGQTLELGNIGVMKAMVAEGLGVAFLYERSARADVESGRLGTIGLRDFAVAHDFSFVYQKDSLFEASYRDFLGFVIRSSEAA